MYAIYFYVPIEHADTVKDALFAAGAGTIGQYARCAWQTLGEGEFMPLTHASPFIGEPHQVTKVPELKIEMVCDEAHILDAVNALKKSHPYETPAFHIIKLEKFT